MGWLRGTALRLNSAGDRVRALQQALADLGFDTGTVDGKYGFLTQEAVRSFQRENRLRVDGVAGPNTMAVLNDPFLGRSRHLHRLQQGETLFDVASRWGISVAALRRSNRIPPRRQPYPGQALVVHSRTVIGAVGSKANPAVVVESMTRNHRQLSGIAVSGWQLQSEGLKEPEHVRDVVENAVGRGLELIPVIHNWNDNEGAFDSLHAVWTRRRRRKRSVTAVVETCRSIPGKVVWLDVGGLQWGEGRGFTRFVADLAEKMNAAGKSLWVTAPLPQKLSPRSFWVHDIDWAVIRRVSARVVCRLFHGGLPVPVDRELSPAYVDRVLVALGRVVPLWKVLLGIALGGRDFSGRSDQFQSLSYQRAITRAYSMGVKPNRGQGERPTTYEYETEDGASHEVWLETRESFLAKVQVVERLNLAGMVLWSLGEEDRRIWDVLEQGVMVTAPQTSPVGE